VVRVGCSCRSGLASCVGVRVGGVGGSPLSDSVLVGSVFSRRSCWWGCGGCRSGGCGWVERKGLCWLVDGPGVVGWFRGACLVVVVSCGGGGLVLVGAGSARCWVLRGHLSCCGWLRCAVSCGGAAVGGGGGVGLWWLLLAWLSNASVCGGGGGVVGWGVVVC
jgi:hypothetical protein